MRRMIGVVTSSRADFSFYLPLLRAMQNHPACEPVIFATGMHLAEAFGSTVQLIEEAGFRVAARIESLSTEGTPEAVGRSIGRGVIGFAELFARLRPDGLLVFGDRFDMIPAALAALPYRIPVAHIAGGELTEGAIDDALRHALTKLSHLHFVATESYAQRVRQMGEEAWRVNVTGSLAVDAMRQATCWNAQETAQRFQFDASRPMALVTYHPVTLEADRTERQVDELLAVLEASGLQCVFTAPNADTSWPEVVRAIERFCDGWSGRQFVANAGTIGYFSLMRAAAVMVGNSSSGLVEAPSFALPVVNVGTRQSGRVRAANVIDCGTDREGIMAALARALEPGFRRSLRGLENPYGDGRAAQRILARLAETDFGAPDLLRKRFMDASLERFAEAFSP